MAIKLFEFERSALTQPSPALLHYAQEAAKVHKDGQSDDRRADARRSWAVPVLAMPVDEKLRACGEPFLAVSRDISLGGIAMYHTAEPSSRFLALEIDDPWGGKLRVLLNSLRCRKVDSFVEIAGKFVMKLDG